MSIKHAWREFTPSQYRSVASGYVNGRVLASASTEIAEIIKKEFPLDNIVLVGIGGSGGMMVPAVAAHLAYLTDNQIWCITEDRFCYYRNELEEAAIHRERKLVFVDDCICTGNAYCNCLFKLRDLLGYQLDFDLAVVIYSNTKEKLKIMGEEYKHKFIALNKEPVPTEHQEVHDPCFLDAMP